MNRKQATLLGILIISAILLIITLASQNRIPVRIGVPNHPSGALLILAHELGYFDQMGLDATMVDYPSGKRALKDGLLKGKVDLIGSASIPVVLASPDHPELRVLASTAGDLRNINSVVSRKDLGVEQPTDLSGKRIGTQRFSAVHYFQERFLAYYQVGPVEKIWLKAEELVPALVAGEIDAFTMRDPFVAAAAKQLGERFVEFKFEGFVQHEVLATTTSFITAQPEAIEKILQALVMAEEYIKANRFSAAEKLAMKIDSTPEKLMIGWSSQLPTVEINDTLSTEITNIFSWSSDQLSNPHHSSNNLFERTPMPKVR